MKSHDLGSIDAAAPAFVGAFFLRSLYAFPLPVLYEPALHLSHHSQHRHHDATDLAPSRDVRFQHGDEGSPPVALMDNVKNVARVTAKPVDASYDQLVAGAQEVDYRLEFSAAIARSAGDLFGPD